ncbi:MAG TPA: 6-carboxytetrahydropterin synthase QueD [Bacteroidota bacterium]
MHAVVKRLHFCYGHRLLDYDGKCSHPHGHNGLVEIELKSKTLDKRGMVVDFSDVKRRVMAFIEKELDHRMLLRKDDPLVSLLERMGEAPFVMAENPTAENIARVIYRHARDEGLPVVAVRLWETHDAFAEYREEEE